MSWLSNLGNTVENWFGFGKKKKSLPTAQAEAQSTTAPDPEAPLKNFIKNAPKIGGQIGENQRMKRELLDGTFKKGGNVKKTGIYKLHKGEYVINKKKAEIARKM